MRPETLFCSKNPRADFTNVFLTGFVEVLYVRVQGYLLVEAERKNSDRFFMVLGE